MAFLGPQHSVFVPSSGLFSLCLLTEFFLLEETFERNGCVLSLRPDCGFVFFSIFFLMLLSKSGRMQGDFFFFYQETQPLFFLFAFFSLWCLQTMKKTFYQDSLSSLSPEQFFPSLCLRKCSRSCCWSQTLSDTFLLCSRYPGT